VAKEKSVGRPDSVAGAAADVDEVTATVDGAGAMAEGGDHVTEASAGEACPSGVHPSSGAEPYFCPFPVIFLFKCIASLPVLMSIATVLI